jgi:hypothetical protein
MARYYFDLRDGDQLAVDEEGMELPIMQAVQVEAARSWSISQTRDLDQSRHHPGHRMAIEVRNESGAVLQAKFIFELEH